MLNTVPEPIAAAHTNGISTATVEHDEVEEDLL